MVLAVFKNRGLCTAALTFACACFVFVPAYAATSTNTTSKGSSKSSSGSQDLSPITLIKKGYKSFLRAQNFGPSICTDRNSVTPHPNAVPLGYLQIEGGSTFNLFNSGGSIILPETVFRLGTWKYGEMRFQVPNYVTSSGRLGRFRGNTDIQVSIKQELERHIFAKMKGLDIGVIAGLTLPTGSDSVSTQRVDPFVQLIGFYRYKNFTLGSSQSLFMPSELPDNDVLVDRPGRTVAYQPTVILFRHLSLRDKQVEDMDIWVEYAGLFPEGFKTSQVIDMGLVFRPVRRHQVDFRFGFGLDREAPRTFLGFGYSWLPGKVIPFYKRAPEHTYRP